MNRRLFVLIGSTFILITLILRPSGQSTIAATTNAYVITDLGTLGGASSRAYGINNLGHIVGESQTATGQTHAFLWKNGTMRDLGTLGGPSSSARGINDAGQVVGKALTDDWERAFLWQNNNMIDLGAFDDLASAARAINVSGQVVGSSAIIGARDMATLWQNGTMTYVGGLDGLESFATDLNRAGQVVGSGETQDSGYHGFIVRNGATTDLGTLGGNDSYASSINDNGQVVGTAALADGNSHAFLWQDWVMTDLGTLGASNSSAEAINNIGQIVGTSGVSTGDTRPFIWRNGTMIDLTTLLPAASGWSQITPHAINDLGQIAGYGTINGQTHAFLLTPGQSFEAEACQITSPFTLHNGVVSQAVETTDPAQGGKLLCPFSVPAMGKYVVKVVLHAPEVGSNSLFMNIDAEPTSPTMIWDITPLTTALAERTASWRGNGSSTTNQFVPKVFDLAAGMHQLVIRGREADVQIDRIEIVAYMPTAPTQTPITPSIPTTTATTMISATPTQTPPSIPTTTATTMISATPTTPSSTLAFLPFVVKEEPPPPTPIPTSMPTATPPTLPTQTTAPTQTTTSTLPPQPTLPPITGTCKQNEPSPLENGQAWVTDPAPPQNSTQTVCARLITNGQARPDVPVTIKVYYKTTTSTYTGTTNSEGVSPIAFKIGSATVGYQVRIDVQFTTGHTATTSFIPR